MDTAPKDSKSALAGATGLWDEEEGGGTSLKPPSTYNPSWQPRHSLSPGPAPSQSGPRKLMVTGEGQSTEKMTHKQIPNTVPQTSEGCLAYQKPPVTTSQDA